MKAAQLILSLCILALLANPLIADPESDLQLANELAEANRHGPAALEYRRVAMDTKAPLEQASFFWMAGYEYLRAGLHEQAERMLGKVEDATMNYETEIYFLRSELSSLRQRYREALFYLESLVDNESLDPTARQLASRRLACARMRLDDIDGAKKALENESESHRQASFKAITSYQEGSDKNPVIGGTLGLIPGLGYAYSGEYANAARSLILNALCIWGIVALAEDESWGGVAVVGFAGITFYSGSIYGGADSAVRYNKHRINACLQVINDNARFEPDRSKLPALALKFKF
jgi:hypothetical protein